jgi:SAM-dependent methyltransferase
MTIIPPDQIHEEVQKRYSRIAEGFKAEDQACCDSNTSASSCCDDGSDSSDALFGDLYEADTGWLPDDVTGLSLGCGDPTTLAQLQPGQTVVDLGSGGGIDCFMAARAVGESGRVIGVDMTPAMIEKANKSKAQLGLDNVEFRQGQIEALTVADDTVDVIVSNCVINLSPDKAAVFREAYRVLKPGGKLAVSDIVTQGRFSAEERANMAAWTGCITGAEDVADYVAAIAAAGFVDISVRDKASPKVELAGSSLSAGSTPYTFSARVTAVKPER